MNTKLIRENVTRSYYSFSASVEHRTGDIWRSVSTHGLLSVHTNSAVMITPACDLANAKVETLTYLPVVPVLTWLFSFGFFAEIRGSLVGALRQVGLNKLAGEFGDSKEPTADLLDQAERAIATSAEQTGKKKSLEAQVEQVRNGLTAVRAIAACKVPEHPESILGGTFGQKKWKEICARIVTNSYRNDIHYLPADGQPGDWTAVKDPSVVLFRYPLTAPISIFDKASDVSITDWQGEMERHRPRFPIAATFASARPLKCCRLQHEFLVTLLTRFSALYSRIGCSDFSPGVVEQFAKDLAGY